MKLYEYQRSRVLIDLRPNFLDSIFYMEPPWGGGTKACSNGTGHMTKMAAMPIYGRNQ